MPKSNQNITASFSQDETEIWTTINIKFPPEVSLRLVCDQRSTNSQSYSLLIMKESYHNHHHISDVFLEYCHHHSFSPHHHSSPNAEANQSLGRLNNNNRCEISVVICIQVTCYCQVSAEFCLALTVQKYQNTSSKLNVRFHTSGWWMIEVTQSWFIPLYPEFIKARTFDIPGTKLHDPPQYEQWCDCCCLHRCFLLQIAKIYIYIYIHILSASKCTWSGLTLEEADLCRISITSACLAQLVPVVVAGELHSVSDASPVRIMSLSDRILSFPLILSKDSD